MNKIRESRSVNLLKRAIDHVPVIFAIAGLDLSELRCYTEKGLISKIL